MTDPIKLTNEGETVASVDADSLLVWIDETGHERFQDPQYPVFGLGGCATYADEYEACLHEPWMELKRSEFAGTDAQLHAAEMHDATPAQLAAIGEFFQSEPFFRVAVTLTEVVDLPDRVDAYQLVAGALYNRITDVAEARIPSKVVFVLEEADRLRGLATRCFSGYEMVARSDGESWGIPMDHYFMPKNADTAGLEVADFVMHAAGTHRRERVQGNDTDRQDYNAVFREVDAQLVSVFNIGVM